MNKVTTINLNGRAYQLEERGYDALHTYLSTAAAKLHGNPDKDEIMADFEQAIADKFDKKLSASKNVVLEREVHKIITEMGPVDAAEGTTTGSSGGSGSQGANTSGSDTSWTAGAPKRLYRLAEGRWIMGVCTGLAAYFNIDLILTRIIFVLLLIITHGFMTLVYIVLALVVPVAKTDEERAMAHGWTTRPPLKAHDIIEQAKAKYAEMKKMHEENKQK